MYSVVTFSSPLWEDTDEKLTSSQNTSSPPPPPRKNTGPLLKKSPVQSFACSVASRKRNKNIYRALHCVSCAAFTCKLIYLLSSLVLLESYSTLQARSQHNTIMSYVGRCFAIFLRHVYIFIVISGDLACFQWCDIERHDSTRQKQKRQAIDNSHIVGADFRVLEARQKFPAPEHQHVVLQQAVPAP